MPAIGEIRLADKGILYPVMGVKTSGYQEQNQLVVEVVDTEQNAYPDGLPVTFEHRPLGGSTLSDPDRFKFDGDGYHVRSTQEMRRLFAELPEACDNTLTIARRCAYMPTPRKPILPRYTKLANRTEKEALQEMASSVPNIGWIHLRVFGNSSAGLHSDLLNNRARLGRSEEFYQRLRRVRCRRCRVQARGIHRYVLDVGWQRPEVVDALHMQKFADLLEAEVSLSACDQLANLNAGRGLLHLVLDLIGDTHLFEQIRKIEAARP